MRGKYICFEGSEGVGKTTQVALLIKHLKYEGAKVLHTKEPGTDLCPLTLELRKLILDAKYDDPETGWVELTQKLNFFLKDQDSTTELTSNAKDYLQAALLMIDLHKKMIPLARELILQSVRSITLERVVVPGLKTHDYVIQDRGILSGLSYGEAGDIDLSLMYAMNNKNVKDAGLSEDWISAYTQVIMLRGNVAKGLSRAQSAKKEFESDDVMEKKGVTFLEKVNTAFTKHLSEVKDVAIIVVDNKSIDEIHSEILGVLK